MKLFGLIKATEDDTPQIIQGVVHSETGKLTLTFKLVEFPFNCSSIRTCLNYRVLLNYDYNSCRFQLGKITRCLSNIQCVTSQSLNYTVAWLVEPLGWVLHKKLKTWWNWTLVYLPPINHNLAVGKNYKFTLCSMSNFGYHTAALVQMLPAQTNTAEWEGLNH